MVACRYKEGKHFCFIIFYFLEKKKKEAFRKGSVRLVNNIPSSSIFPPSKCENVLSLKMLKVSK